jgi:hypothetical protein
LLALLAGCAPGSAAGPDAGAPDAGPPSAPGVSVGGTYPTRVSLTANGCGAVEVQDALTTVTQAPGDAALALTHAGNRYPGSVGLDGAFATSPGC